MNVGKNRMESLGDVQETADLMYYSALMMEKNNGFVKPMGKDPLVGYDATNTSVLKPYGVWLIVSPFNFPFALTGGPTGAALVAGNTVVIKPATDTAWIVRLYAECLRDAGFPNGVVNFVTGPGSTLGQALVDSPEFDGATFTGSFDVGMKLFRDFANRNYVRPVVLELGGKNPVIVSRNANLEDAATGIVRSAFGLQGQKCSAASRVIVEAPVYDELIAKLKGLTEKLVIGDPTERTTYLGPVINKSSYNGFQECSTKRLDQAGGKFLTGGNVKTGGMYDKGYFCEPTFVTDLPFEHRLWQYEMFLPITTIGKVDSLDEAMKIANSVNYGLTAGFYGSPKETNWFFDQHRSGCDLCQPSAGCNNRCLAGLPTVRRLERLRRERQERRRLLLRPAVHARADPDTGQTRACQEDRKESCQEGCQESPSQKDGEENHPPLDDEKSRARLISLYHFHEGFPQPHRDIPLFDRHRTDPAVYRVRCQRGYHRGTCRLWPLVRERNAHHARISLPQDGTACTSCRTLPVRTQDQGTAGSRQKRKNQSPAGKEMT